MFITPRCNYAGPLGNLIPTRSPAFFLLGWLRALVRMLTGTRGR